MAKKKINHISKNSEKFLEKYLNTASPTGFESEGQKVWLDYIKPYIDSHILDTYGSVVGVINPEAKCVGQRRRLSSPAIGGYL